MGDDFQESVRMADAANTGAYLCLIGLAELGPKYDVEDPRFILGLLARKVCSHVRAAYTLIMLGYYAEAAMLLRPAFEGMSLLIYFAKKPEKAEEWVALEVECSESEGDKKQRAVGGKQLIRKAALDALRTYLNDEAGSSLEREDFRWLLNRLSYHAHPSLPGLADEFGEQVSPWDFLSVDFELEDALEVTGDLGAAVKLRRLRRQKQHHAQHHHQSVEEAVSGQGEPAIVSVPIFNDRVQGELLSDLSVYCLLTAHHLSHLMEYVWPNIWNTSKDLKKAHRRWHKEVIQKHPGDTDA